MSKTRNQSQIQGAEPMVVTPKQQPNSQITAITFHGIPNDALRAMTSDELALELARVDYSLRRWEKAVSAHPSWFRSVPGVRAERNGLFSEKRRIERELKRRAAELEQHTGWTD